MRQKAAAELKIRINVGIAIYLIKPFKVKPKWIKILNKSRFGGIILDDDYTQEIADSLAYNLLKKVTKMSK